MSKRLRYLVTLLKEVFSPEIINSIALKTKFKIRKGKITPDMFVALCVLYGRDLCQSSLIRLSTRLNIKEDIEISPQALDQRFNKHAVSFLRQIFERLIHKHNNETLDDLPLRKMLFANIKVVDSTVIQLPENLAVAYKGTGGDGSKSAVKIQLEYEVLSGKFLACQINSGSSSDMAYLPYSEAKIEKGELHLKDLGYFKTDHLQKIHQAGAFYISKIKKTASAYLKDPNPELKRDGTINKKKAYKKIDIQQIAQPLAEGQSIECLDTYMGITKLKSRLIVTKLTKECKQNREKKHRLAIRKGKRIRQDNDDAWNSINTYITNIPQEIATAEQIHNLYTLRWQIENMFKVWKSIFGMAGIKKVKVERFECFLYGRLIELLLAASIVSTSKVIAVEEGIQPLSELKTFSIVNEYLEGSTPSTFKTDNTLIAFIDKTIQRIIKHGLKSRKKGTVYYGVILEFLRCNSLTEGIKTA